eukprot:947883-Pelagomonas_calceolata.AAC.5
MGGDYLFFGKRYGLGVWACVLLMILSACAGGMTDANFSWSGYSWQIINCFFTSGRNGLCKQSKARIVQFKLSSKDMHYCIVSQFKQRCIAQPFALFAAVCIPGIASDR